MNRENMTTEERNQVTNRLGGFAHRFIPAPSSKKKSSITLLLLHGTGGNENDLIPFGRELPPNASILSPRGKVIENGMPSFFRRFAEGVFEVEDLKSRSNELADFITSASKEYEFNPDGVVAVGYSNGANIAAGILLLRPEVLFGAVLLRATLPFVPERLPNLSGKSIFLSERKYDQYAGPANAERLKEILQRSGAIVTLNWESIDHSLTQEEIYKAREFLSSIQLTAWVPKRS
jgi:phospholipase/carboxylesterase